MGSGAAESVATFTSAKRPFNQVDFTRNQNNQPHRTVVPNHVIPSDVPADIHPNASYANNFIRYICNYLAVGFALKV